MAIVPVFDDSQMPIRLGSPLRVPIDAWQNWGINYNSLEEKNRLIREAEITYEKEWQSSSARRLSLIKNSNSNNQVFLNNGNANVVTEIFRQSSKNHFNILDVGAGTGETSIAIYNKIPVQIRNKVSFTLIEPVKALLDVAIRRLNNLGVGVKGHLVSDLYMEQLKEHFDIIVAVASIHHHSDLTLCFKIIYNLLNTGGYFITADWHHSLFEHPAHVYNLLSAFHLNSSIEWQTYYEDIRHFVECFPLAIQPIKLPLFDEKANKYMIDWWNRHIVNIQQDKATIRFLLEGHRPAFRYVQDMASVGFMTDCFEIRSVLSSNPFFLTRSHLWAITLGFKGCRDNEKK